MTRRACVVLVLIILVTGAMRSMQGPDHPFSEAEIYAALRLMRVPEDEARAAANEATSPAVASFPEGERSTEGLEFTPIPTVQFFGDFLAVLSLVSDATRRKVEIFRRGTTGTQISAEEEVEWEMRRQELARTLKGESD